HQGDIYLDLGDADWRAVRVTAAGWTVVTEPPVRFVRKRGMRPLPVPVSGGSIRELRKFVNIGSRRDWRLIVGWLVQALRPQGPYILLALHGEQGSAKSTAARLLRALLDPTLLVFAASRAACRIL